MPYLVRKLNKRTSLNLIGAASDYNNMLADAATSEFRTRNGTLSTWRIESLEELDRAVLAIAVSSTKIDRMDFIAINTDYLEHEELDYQQTYAGMKIAVSDLQDLHYDICNVTMSKLYNCFLVYKKVLEQDQEKGTYIFRRAEGSIRDLITKAIGERRVDVSKLSDEMREQLPIIV